MKTLLLDAGMLTIQELTEDLFGRRFTSGEDLALAPKKPVFNRGDFVRVKPYRQDDNSGIGWRCPLIRVPGYIYGMRGIVGRVCSERKDPSILTFGLDVPTARLYRIRFRMKDIQPEVHYGKNENAIKAEVYEASVEVKREEVVCCVLTIAW